mgnify:CR=1 FL=1
MVDGIDRPHVVAVPVLFQSSIDDPNAQRRAETVSYTHLRAHETVLDIVCRLLLEKKKHTNQKRYDNILCDTSNDTRITQIRHNRVQLLLSVRKLH